jgi:hypothetical protein
MYVQDLKELTSIQQELYCSQYNYHRVTKSEFFFMNARIVGTHVSDLQLLWQPHTFTVQS